VDYNTLAGAKSLEGSLKYWVNHSELPVGEIITDAQNEVYSRLRVREMLASASLSIAVNDSTAPLPSGFLDPLSLLDQWGDDIVLRDLRVLRRLRSFDSTGTLIVGPISNYAINGTTILFDMASNATTTFPLDYFQKPTVLSAGNPTNFLTTRYSHLFRAALLKHAYAFRKAFDEARIYAAELEAQIPGNRD
jgi:hypothetical protein